jgi:hypothetical protein
MQEAIAALARHVCFKVPDKADARSAAAKTATELATLLPQWEQDQLVGFTYHLSRSNKVSETKLSQGIVSRVGRCLGTSCFQQLQASFKMAGYLILSWLACSGVYLLVCRTNCQHRCMAAGWATDLGSGSGVLPPYEPP